MYIYIYINPYIHPSIHPSLSSLPLSLWSLYLIWFSIICPCHIQKEPWKTCRQDADRGSSGRRSTPFWTPGISGRRPRRPSPPREFSCCARGFEPAAYGPGGEGQNDLTSIMMMIWSLWFLWILMILMNSYDSYDSCDCCDSYDSGLIIKHILQLY